MIGGKPYTMDKKEWSSVFFMLSLSVDSGAKSKSDDLANENSEVTSKLGKKPHRYRQIVDLML
jgi:hypothetical protein